MVKSSFEYQEEIHKLKKQLLVNETKLERAKDEQRSFAIYAYLFLGLFLLQSAYLFFKYVL